MYTKNNTKERKKHGMELGWTNLKNKMEKLTNWILKPGRKKPNTLRVFWKSSINMCI